MQGVLFFDRMTEEVLDSIRMDLKVSRTNTYKYLIS